MIRNVSDSQTDILRDILDLHLPGQATFDLDPCYGPGSFYKYGTVPIPRHCWDVLPQAEHVEARNVLSLKDGGERYASIIFDPPFLHAHGKNSAVGNRYQSYANQKALWAFYVEALHAMREALVPGGILVWKCQDIVESGKQVWNHCKIWELCRDNGMYPMDLFVLVARNRIVGHNHKKQQHARKFTAYFWVFKKT